MKIFGIEVTLDFSPPLLRDEEVTRDDGVTGRVTHFDGDIDEEGSLYDNLADNDVWVEWSDGRKSWEYPKDLQRKGKRR